MAFFRGLKALTAIFFVLILCGFAACSAPAQGPAPLPAPPTADLTALLEGIKSADQGQFAISEEDGKFLRVLVATRGTERAAEFPLHVVCEWIGNSRAVAQRHYLTVTDDDFTRATSAEKAPKDLAGNSEKQEEIAEAENG